MKRVAHREEPGRLSSFIDSLQERGRYTFERAEAEKAVGTSEVAFKNALRRLVAKGRLARPRRGFYVIVPVEYRSAGAPPPAWYIDDLMRSLQVPYYVGLLSAAALHGAAHQQPQEFQVIVGSALRPSLVGRARIKFFTKQDLARTPVAEMKTETGVMRVSTPEATALDLVVYTAQAGHLNNVATVLGELAERLDPKALLRVATADVERTQVQRLGYLLEFVGAVHLSKPLAKWIERQQTVPVPLRPGWPASAARRNDRWNLLVNETIEADT